MDLRPDEQKLYEGRPAWRALLSFYVAGLLVAAVAVAVLGWLLDAPGPAAGVGVAIVVLTLVVGYLRRLFTRYLITNQRLRISRGFIARHVQEARLDRVQNVNYGQGLIDRVFNVGTVDFDTAGTDDAEFRFAWVARPEEVVRAVHQAVEETGPEPER
jgi:uncharacterized membrane protein YdbT with pleckstrin-like domain